MSAPTAGAAGGPSGGTTSPPMGPPYAPAFQGLGSPPTVIPDVPVSAVFLVLFLITGAIHMTLLQVNKKHGHKFMFSGAMFGFCFIRVISSALRIAWVYNLKSVSLAIAAQIFVAAGTIILYVVNLFFVQRLMRARHPHIGWSKPFKILVLPVAVGITVISLIMVIVVTVYSFFTLNGNAHRIIRDIQLYVATLFTFIAFLPIPICIIMILIPRRTYIDKFGAGRFRTKIIVLLFSSALLALGAGFRCGTAWLTPLPLDAAPAWYYSKACFYIFNFSIEITVAFLYVLVRVDRRFYVPDAAEGPGTYSGDVVSEKPVQWPRDNYSLYDLAHHRESGSVYGDTLSGRTQSMLSVDKSGKYRLSQNTSSQLSFSLSTTDGAWSTHDRSPLSAGRDSQSRTSTRTSQR